jgi:hypothetical protein
MHAALTRIATIALFALLATACADAPAVQLVKTGTLKGCPGQTVGEMVDGFMGNPSWEAIVADDGKTYVNIEGDVMLSEKSVRALLQFAIDESDQSFVFRSMEANEVPMPGFFGLALLGKMCEEKGSETASSEPEADAVEEEAPAPPPSAPTDHWGTFSGSSGVVSLSLMVSPSTLTLTQDTGESFEMCQADVPEGFGYNLSVNLTCSEEMEFAGVRAGLLLNYLSDGWSVNGTGAFSGLAARLERDR